MAQDKLKSRKMASALLQDAMSQYNKGVPQDLRLNMDEQKAIMFLAGRSPDFRRLLKLIWGQSKPSMSAVPMNLLTERWLLPTDPLPVHTP